MAGCEVGELVKAIRQTNAILAGDEVDLTVPIEDQLDYTTDTLEGIRGVVPALLAIEAAEVGEVVTLEEVIAEMDNSLLENLADLSEVLIFLKELLPNWSLQIPITDLLEAFSLWRYRQSHINLLYDIAISQRGQAVAQGGVDGAAIYETLGDKMDELLAVGSTSFFGPLAGAATWLWLNIRPTKMSGWVDFFSSISGWLLGSIRGATYDVAEAIENLRTGGMQVDVEGDDFCCGGGGVEGGTGTNFEQELADPSGDPPAGSDEPDAAIVDRKCKAANLIVDELMTILSAMAEVDGNIMMYYTVPLRIAMIRETVANTDTILGKIVMGVAGAAQNIAWWLFNAAGLIDIDSIVTTLNTNKEYLVCTLYQAGTPATAHLEFVQALEDIGLSITERDIINYYLPNDAVNLLWFARDNSEAIIDIYPTTVDCTCGGSGCECISVTLVGWGGYRFEEVGGTTFLVLEASTLKEGTWGNYNSAKIQFSPSVYLKYRDDLSTLVETGDADYPYEVSVNEDGVGWENYTLGNSALDDWLPNLYWVITVRTSSSDSTLEAWFECSDVDPTA
jgi:hypothetical protein